MGERFEVELDDGPASRRRGRRAPQRPAPPPGAVPPWRSDGAPPPPLEAGEARERSGEADGSGGGAGLERRTVLLAGAVLGAVLVFALGWSLGASGGESASPTANGADVTAEASPTPSTSPADDPARGTLPPVAPSTTRAPSTTAQPPIVEIVVGRSLLPAPSGMRLVGVSSDGDLVEVDVDAATVRVTELPRLRGVVGPGESSVIATDDAALVVRQGEAVHVPAGREPRRIDDLPGMFGYFPAPVPGSRPGTVWVLVDGNTYPPRFTARLVSLDGDDLGVELDLGTWYPLGSDQQGGLLLVAPGGTYRAGEDGIQRLADGQVVATGRNHLVVLECDPALQCGAWLVERATGVRTPVPVEAFQQYAWFGYPQYPVLSPDGTAAIVAAATPATGQPTLSVVELTSGETTELLSSPDGPWGWSVVWSDDGRFMAYIDGRDLIVYDRVTGTAQELLDTLPPLVNVSARPAGA